MHKSADDELDHDGCSVDPYEELVVSGSLYLNAESDRATQVRRGMAVLTREGKEAGKVAAVRVDTEHRHVTHILLVRLGNVPEYCLVSSGLVDQVLEENVLLRVFKQVIDSLPAWHGS